MKKFELAGAMPSLGNKLAIKSVKQDKKEIRFTITRSMKDEMTKAINKSDIYNKREKSKWIYDALVLLIKNPSFKEIVLNVYWSRDNEGGVKEDMVHDKVNLSFEERCVFSGVRNDVVRCYPEIRGPQASIIRAAISYRLSRNY